MDEIFNKVYAHVKMEIEKNKKKKSLSVDTFYMYYIPELKNMSEAFLLELNDKLLSQFETDGYRVNKERKKIHWS